MADLDFNITNPNKIVIPLWNSLRFNPADGGTYFFTQWVNSGVDQTESSAAIIAPVSMTIKSFYGAFYSSAGSNEAVTFSIGINGVYTVVSDTFQMTATENFLSNNSLNISVAQGDKITVRMLCPTWATNPSNLRGSINLYAQ